jgi:hypothetical protein
MILHCSKLENTAGNQRVRNSERSMRQSRASETAERSGLQARLRQRRTRYVSERRRPARSVSEALDKH